MSATATVRERPEELEGRTIKATCGCGSLYIVVNELAGEPFEVFIHSGKNGDCAHTIMNALSISISHGLRAGVPLEEYSRALLGFECKSKIGRVQGKGESAHSCIDAMAKVFQNYLDSRSPTQPAEAERPEGRETRGKSCSQCGGQIVYESGCDRCLSCGHSENCE